MGMWKWMSKGKAKGKGKGKSIGKSKGKGKGKREATEAREPMDDDDDGDGPAIEGEGGERSTKRRRHRGRLEKRDDLEPLNEAVLEYLEEMGGSAPLSDVASKCPCYKQELIDLRFVFGPPNDAADVNVYPPDSVVPEGAPVPPSRLKRKTEIEVLDELLDFMEETDGHAPLRDIHRKFKLKEKPKKRMEVLGFTFADNVEHGGCEVHLPDEARGDTRAEWMEKAADIAREKNIYSKHFGSNRT